MAGLIFRHVSKVYDGGKQAVDDFCLEVADGEFIAIVGPSGCGKTTTLRMIAGLESITSGELYIDGRLVNDEKPSRRDVEMVFQDDALFPQMTVYQNMAFGLKNKKWYRKALNAEIDLKIRQAAEVLGITDILQSRPNALSGGQRRRVALGRALVGEPKVFLLDEPLSGLDAQLRSTMRGEIIKLHRLTNTTFIYVTHDQVEAMTMGTRIVVMNDGKIQQADTPDAVYNRPANKFTAGFLGSPQMSFLSGSITCDGQTATVQISGAQNAVVPSALFSDISKAFKTGEALVFGFRADAIVSDDDVQNAAIAEMTVSHTENFGAERYVYGDIGGASATFKAALCDDPKSGERITVKLDLGKAHIFDGKSGRSVCIDTD